MSLGQSTDAPDEDGVRPQSNNSNIGLVQSFRLSIVKNLYDPVISGKQ